MKYTQWYNLSEYEGTCIHEGELLLAAAVFDPEPEGEQYLPAPFVCVVLQVGERHLWLRSPTGEFGACKQTGLFSIGSNMFELSRLDVARLHRELDSGDLLTVMHRLHDPMFEV